MADQTQPNQVHCKASFAAGVLTFTTDIYCNPAVATSVADSASAVSTVTAPASGQLHIVTVVTPNSAIVSANTPVLQDFKNTSSPSA